jgi:hypothetical protein
VFLSSFLFGKKIHFINAAAVARKIYLRQGTGVGALKKRFGGSYRFGSKGLCFTVSKPFLFTDVVLDPRFTTMPLDASSESP